MQGAFGILLFMSNASRTHKASVRLTTRSALTPQAAVPSSSALAHETQRGHSPAYAGFRLVSGRADGGACGEVAGHGRITPNIKELFYRFFWTFLPSPDRHPLATDQPTTAC